MLSVTDSFDMRYAFLLLLTFAIGLAVQSLALHAHGGRAAKSESNYFSSLGRLQAGVRGEPEVMVLGSSITGRLPDRSQGFVGWSNMGCDGGSAVDALRAIDKGHLSGAPLLLIEANTLHMPLAPSTVNIGDNIRGPWFQLGLKVPAVASYSRPASFIYSKLLERKIGTFGSIDDSDDLGVTSHPQLVTGYSPDGFKPKYEELIEEVCGILGRLQAKGSRVVIVWLPPARKTGDSRFSLATEIARRSGVFYWDLGQEAALGTVQLTDGVHMTPGSAARTMRSLGRVVSPR